MFPLPSWLRHGLCLCVSTAFVAKAVVTKTVPLPSWSPANAEIAALKAEIDALAWSGAKGTAFF